MVQGIWRIKNKAVIKMGYRRPGRNLRGTGEDNVEIQSIGEGCGRRLEKYF